MLITQIDSGLFKVEIPDWQIQIFHKLGKELKAILSDGNSHLTTRLFPAAYQSDSKANTEYELLTHEDLRQSHLSSIKLLAEISTYSEVSESTLIEIMQGINILRLVLGERLEINDENNEEPTEFREDEDDYNLWLLFHLLGEILSNIIDSINP
tara:strand:- start:71 stop:532 length:462 start_codon:yes stop_codon:yes gene_type:complete